VLFESSLNESSSFLSLTQNLKNSDALLRCLVFDNSPITNSIKLQTQSFPWQFSFEHHPENPGLSKAYNRGFEIAQKAGKKWLLLLDQDTQFPINAFEKYFEAVSRFPNEALFAPVLSDGSRIFSPCGYFYKLGYHLKQIEPGLTNFRGKSVLNSGILIRVNAFKLAGGYNERIRLDYSDHEFIERLKLHCPNFVVLDLQCLHDVFENQNDFQKSIQRFRVYHEGAMEFATNLVSKLVLGLQVIRKMIRLSIRFRSLQFLKILLTK